ncbi:carboxypeptidase-like regulatory domain-containing protein [Flavitalea sp. BT771]|uniref:carboxypeptidase-like regulatory domain-containing protein n=1 Tax=Flavitalea sp. BT771 TaxID=3063329 RepID=UPI0026E1FF0D|nr:carboxypeptidase-like regulatory domain-containing protein [Flavitalea sp. BT771]MDO6429871.1 carboxypeptidase-like regulatory domain-containing protein [Flavitalea sp. BT771]MDV6218001.1 carboxypeptidase-like regulatory domain-containing protein [Flavitalea sp. BT771]
MRKLLLLLTFPIILLTVFIACNKYKDSLPPPSSGNELPEEKTVTASLQGKVVDENGQAVADATVTSGDASTSTDDHGIFNFTNIKLSSRFGYVKVVKTGYFAGSRSILATPGSENFVSIKLLPRTSKGSFSASGGGVVTVQAGTTVTFEGASVVIAATNAAYGGTVHVYASYLDQTTADVAVRMPGDLRGIGSDGKETLLQSFGMMVVELEGDGGEKLQIAGGKKATLSMKIPDAEKASAPATIPLWYFNDTTGRWIEQGVATRKGDLYVGETTHFSWWNCDAPVGTVTFHVRLKDAHGTPLSYTYLRFTSPTLGTRGGFTDADGYASGLIPKGEVLKMEAMNSCGSAYFGVNIGPALGDQELGTLTVTDDRATLALTGTVVNCNGGAVDSGYVEARVDGLSYRIKVVKGAFSLAIPRCGDVPANAALVVGDYKTQQQSNSISVPVTSGSVDAGKLSACGSEINQYFNITFKGQTYNITVPPDLICYSEQPADTSRWYLFSVDQDYNNYGLTYIWWIQGKEFKGVGTYRTSGYMTINDVYYIHPQADDTSPKCTIKTFGAVNEFITGSISGQYKDSTDTWFPLTCDFKVKRRR